MTLEDFKSYSEEYLASYGNMSRNTQDQKRRGVEKFIRFMESEGRQEIDQKAILAYRKSLLGYSRNTFAQYISRLNTVLEWMVESGMLDKNPISKKMRMSEKYISAKSVLSADDIRRIFSTSTSSFGRKPVYIRNRAMTILLLTSGARESEMLALTPADLNWEEGYATIRSGKGGKGRTVPFIPYAQMVMHTYLNKARPKEAVDKDPIFVQKNEGGGFKPLSRITAIYGIKSYVEAMTGREDITPHSLRHTCASMLVSSGMNPKELQMLLGHSSLDMTQRYAQMLKPQTEIAAETRKVFEGILETTPGLA